MSLASGMRDKLLRREEIDLPNRKANEYNIRQYVLRYFNDMEEILWILDTLPERQVDKLLKDGKAASLAMRLTERIIEKMDLPKVRRKGVPVVGRRNELEAVKSFDLGPFNKKYYLETKDEKKEITTFGYSFTRDLTLDEKIRVNEVLWHIDDLRSLLVPGRVTIEDCRLEDFLKKIIPPLVEDAKKKGVLHQVMIDHLDTIYPLDEMAAIARQNKTEAKEEPK